MTKEKRGNDYYRDRHSDPVVKDIMYPQKKRKKKKPVPPKPTDLVHCTIATCGRMHMNADKCPSCGNTDSQRPLKQVGVPIYMTAI